mgnify:CR=1 FL=1
MSVWFWIHLAFVVVMAVGSVFSSYRWSRAPAVGALIFNAYWLGVEVQRMQQ